MVESLLDDPLLKEVPVVDGYKVLEPCVLFANIGQGGLGAVYRGRHLTLDIDVAVKCLKTGPLDDDGGIIERFQREAKVAATIVHQNLIHVYHVDHRHGLHYLVMEYLNGENLRERVQRKGRLPIDESISILLAAARGLDAAHTRGVVHRDIKPDNILISSSGQVKVADLGLAKMNAGCESMTSTNIAMGTPQYMPPEQWVDSRKVGPSGDVYALGSSLYFMLSGEDAMAKASVFEVMRRTVDEPFPSIRDKVAEVPEQIAALIQKCTDKDPAMRFQDAGELVRELVPLESQNRGVLLDPEAGQHPKRSASFSPPPRQTLTRIRGTVEESRTPTGEVLLPTHRRPWTWMIAAALLLFAILLALPMLKDEPEEFVLIDGPAVPPSPIEQAFREGEQYFNSGEFELSAASFQKVYEKNANFRDTPARLAAAQRLMAQRYEREGRIDDAWDWIVKCSSVTKGEDPKIEELKSSLEQSILQRLQQNVSIDRPLAGETLNGATLLVEGRAADVLVEKVLVNGNPAILAERGFRCSMENAAEGPLKVDVRFLGKHGLSFEKSVSVTIDRTPPNLQVITPVQSSAVRCPIWIEGTCQDASGRVTVIVNDQPCPLDGNRWRHEVKSAPEGPLAVRVRAMDLPGNEASFQLDLLIKNAAPVMTIEFPPTGFVTKENEVELRGKISDAATTILIEGLPPFSPSPEGFFVKRIPLETNGAKVLRILGRDEVGNETEAQMLRIVRDQNPPVLTISQPPHERELIPGMVEFAGKVSDTDSSYPCKVWIDGEEVSVDGEIWHARLFVSSHETTRRIRMDAEDSAGNRTRSESWIWPVYRGKANEDLGWAKAVPGTDFDDDGNPLEVVHEKSGIVFRLVPAGTYMRGESEGDPDAGPEERPRHLVRVPAFYLSKTEVTNEQWKRITLHPRPPVEKFSGANQPVVDVSWMDVQIFLTRAGGDLRLPTEAEWEYACRGGTTTMRYGELDEIAWTRENSSDQTSAVGVKAPNAYGLLDMLGNVSEWCEDSYERNVYSKCLGGITANFAPDRGNARVHRGGSFRMGAGASRASARLSRDTESFASDLGFRVARTL